MEYFCERIGSLGARKRRCTVHEVKRHAIEAAFAPFLFLDFDLGLTRLCRQKARRIGLGYTDFPGEARQQMPRIFR